ncbi:DUF262 domain-containing protein [Peribacillus sp. NPDC097198]|uniref:DUF262 domain-containing protein n=1 Tax=Peribacillus sp. NPDC097198 TaxID=3364397 RepID=UPI00381C4D14
MPINNSAFKTIGSFLQDNIYHIPDYQREYSWEELQIDDFWLDLKSVVNNEEQDHFFGQIVVHNDEEENKRFIIDGQQRTTTSVIFLSVLNRLFDFLYTNYKDYIARENSEDIRIKYIGRWSPQKDSLRLKLSNKDNRYFMHNIQIDSDNDLEKPKSKSQKRIYDAYNYLYEKIMNEIKKAGNKEQELAVVNEYYDKFINSFKVMYVETNQLEEAFIIFESLNARGKGLETSDLLKNHIFKNARGQIDYVKRSWEKMQSSLENVDTTRYIRHYWNSKEDFVRTVSLYKRIKKKINTESKCITLINELENLAQLYNSISTKENTVYFKNKKLNTSLNNLKTFNASLFFPIVLAMKNKDYSEEDISIVVREIEMLVFRNIIISNKVTNKYEMIFAEIAYAISNKSEIDIAPILTSLQKLQISNSEFENDFKTAKITKKPIIRYIFREINSLFDKEITIIEDNNRIHIEHIMPDKIGDWQIDEDTKEEYLWRLGNLTLLGDEYNREISNKTFNIKLEVYKKSSIEISNNLKKYKEWGIKQIIERQEYLAELALKVWKINKFKIED